MNLSLYDNLAAEYKSSSQKARVITENWIASNMFCPRCGNAKLTHFENNRPVADFFCDNCNNQYELKSQNGLKLEKINDGAYATMIDRIMSAENPDFLFMSYSKKLWVISNLFLVPKHFFTPSIIDKRPPLAMTARRAGWVGCIINLTSIPSVGKIPIIENGQPHSVNEVMSSIVTAEKLYIGDIGSRGWLLDVLTCVDKINGNEFTLEEVYAFENYLVNLHPANNNVKAKIRQQLQILRDKGIIEFTARGKYRKL